MRLTVQLTDHLTVARAKELFGAVEPGLSPGGQDLLVDLLKMTGYDVAARDWFIKEWSPRWRPQLRRLAVVTHKTTFRVAVTAVALATRTQMRAFETFAEAEAWIGK